MQLLSTADTKSMCLLLSIHLIIFHKTFFSLDVLNLFGVYIFPFFLIFFVQISNQKYESNKNLRWNDTFDLLERRKKTFETLIEYRTDKILHDLFTFSLFPYFFLIYIVCFLYVADSPYKCIVLLSFVSFGYALWYSVDLFVNFD